MSFNETLSYIAVKYRLSPGDKKMLKEEHMLALQSSGDREDRSSQISEAYRKISLVINDKLGRRLSPEKIDGKSRRQISARLKEGYSVEDLIGATIAACSLPFFKEKNNKKYMTAEYISRPDKANAYFTMYRESQENKNNSTGNTYEGISRKNIRKVQGQPEG